MKVDNGDELIAMVFGFALGAFLMGMICISTYVKKSEAIEHGAAYYDSKTAEFKWKVEE